MIRRSTPIRRSVKRIAFRSAKRKPADLKYRAWLHLWPCFICFREHCRNHGIPFWEACKLPEARELFRVEFSENHCGPTQACHVGVKGTSQKCAERDMMPLGERHHMHPTMGGFTDSHHAGTAKFWDWHRLSRLRALEFLRHLYVEETGLEI